MVIPRLLVCLLILSRKSLAWSSWFSSEASIDDGEQHNDHLVSPMVLLEAKVAPSREDGQKRSNRSHRHGSMRREKEVEDDDARTIRCGRSSGTVGDCSRPSLKG